MNHTKGSVSLMMAATTDGEILPPYTYVVYKATHLFNTWITNGPKIPDIIDLLLVGLMGNFFQTG